MLYVDYIYDITKALSYKTPVLEGDYIIRKVGIYGFDALWNSGLLESAGEVSSQGRATYILKSKKGR